MNDNGNKGDIIIYKADDGNVAIDVRLEQETVWLTQAQMANLFKTERSVITKHIRNIFKGKELVENAVCAIFAHTAKDGKSYRTFFYNIDMILSVGYRVNSKRGTQFRIWATKVLREHLIKGYTVNDKRLKELRKAVHLITEMVERRDWFGDEAKAILHIVEDYAAALDLLDDYDHQHVVVVAGTERSVVPVRYEEAVEIVKQLKPQFHTDELFGREKDDSVHSSLNGIFQTFEGNDLYPTIEEKAANLLYFLVKNHSFVDGNKRIAAAVFLWFLEKNRMLYRKDGTKRFAENALVAMTLLIAESPPSEKEILTRVMANLLNKKNL